MDEEVTINELIARMVAEMQRVGYSEETIWRDYHPRLCQISRYYSRVGKTFYDLDTTAQFVQLQQNRAKAGEISPKSQYPVISAAGRLDEFYLTGTLRVFPSKKKTHYRLTESNERLVDLFLNDRNFNRKSRHDAEWVARRYLTYWEAHGHNSMEDVSVGDVQKFIQETAAEVKIASLKNIFLYLKHFHIFLKESGIPAPDCVELFSSKINRDMPIQGYVTDEELKQILDVIDTSTKNGKRDRAIILLGATTGLRACDIIHMKLTDIDWRKGEICLVQSKTGHTVHIPLLKEVGEAIQNYILDARPTTTRCQEVFLRNVAPKTAIGDPMCIDSMFRSYQDKAGIVRHPFDGKGFHGLRRHLAKKLLVAGTPLTTISQILGQDNVWSTRQYLSLDTENLKDCALDFA